MSAGIIFNESKGSKKNRYCRKIKQSDLADPGVIFFNLSKVKRRGVDSILGKASGRVCSAFMENMQFEEFLGRSAL